MAKPISYQDHAVDVLAQVASYVRTGRSFAPITSVDIKGGSARDLGSLAVVSDLGEMTGYMSNGCIDQDILQHAMACLDTGTAQLLRYGEGSPFLDLTLPCGGALWRGLVVGPCRCGLTLRPITAHLWRIMRRCWHANQPN